VDGEEVPQPSRERQRGRRGFFIRCEGNNQDATDWELESGVTARECIRAQVGYVQPYRCRVACQVMRSHCRAPDLLRQGREILTCLIKTENAISVTNLLPVGSRPYRRPGTGTGTGMRVSEDYKRQSFGKGPRTRTNGADQVRVEKPGAGRTAHSIELWSHTGLMFLEHRVETLEILDE
jgi:hypothetical protein